MACAFSRRSVSRSGLITARNSEAVASRRRELKMRYVYQGASQQARGIPGNHAEFGCRPFEIAYMGDDWLDLVLISRAGLAFAPANGVKAPGKQHTMSPPRPGGRVPSERSATCSSKAKVSLPSSCRNIQTDDQSTQHNLAGTALPSYHLSGLAYPAGCFPDSAGRV